MSYIPVVDFHGQYQSSCGYCQVYDEKTKTWKRNYGRFAIGMHTYNLTPHSYELLIERGARRSGSYVYFNENDKTCCPQYTIRLDFEKFQILKKQKQVVNRMKHFLETGEKKIQKQEQKKKYTPNEIEKQIIQHIMEGVERAVRDEKLPKLQQLPTAKIFKPRQKSKEFSTGCDYISSIAASFFGQLCKQKCESQFDRPTIAKIIAQNIPSNELIIKTEAHDNGNLLIFIRKQEEEKDVEMKEEVKTEKSSPKHELKCEFIPSKFLEDEYQVYKKYQIAVHKDDPEEVTEKQYTRFLCNSPIQQVTEKGIQFGSFHLRYLLDGKLIGVSVVDILPKGMSSVYFFYDPEYSFLSLGVYSVIKELEIISEFNKKSSAFRYYYMGYYIHNCQKMKYKGQYKPSELMCPISYTFVPLDEVKPLLDKQKFCAFNPNAKDENEATDEDDVIVLFQGKLFPYSKLSQIIPLTQETHENIKLFKKCVGKKLLKILVYYLSEDDLE